MPQNTAVTIYTTNNCFGCNKTKEVLDREGVEYTTVNVQDDPAAFRYVTETLNLRQMPVVVVAEPDDEVVWSGLQPDMIRRYITHREDAAA